MNDLMYKIEALLFSSGRKMNIEELAKICRVNSEGISMTLQELKKIYEEKNSSLIIIDEGNSWKISVRENFIPIVQSIVTETELSKTLMETLAVIAFRYPVLQSEVVKIRSNKAYEHLVQLEEIGYITRVKHGRTNRVALTKKFFEYFELPPEKLKESFKGIEEVAKAIEEKESEKPKDAQTQLINDTSDEEKD
jgi:segregation and condensation protein B